MDKKNRTTDYEKTVKLMISKYFDELPIRFEIGCVTEYENIKALKEAYIQYITNYSESDHIEGHKLGSVYIIYNVSNRTVMRLGFTANSTIADMARIFKMVQNDYTQDAESIYSQLK